MWLSQRIGAVITCLEGVRRVAERNGNHAVRDARSDFDAAMRHLDSCRLALAEWEREQETQQA